ncbi:MAG: PRC-barrel domain-containing protein [Chloroflexota bacterium]
MNIETYEWGIDVYCGDAPCAKLSRIVVDPEEGVVTDIIVEQGLLMKKAHVVPRRHVQQTDERGIWLTMTEEELAEARPYKRRVIEEVADGYDQAAIGVPTANASAADMAALPTVSRVVHDGVASSDMRVLGQDVSVRDLIQEKNVGKLNQVVVDAESGEIVQFEVAGGLFGEDFTLPASMVRHYDEDRILIDEEAAKGVD